MKKTPLILLPGLLSNDTVFQHQITQLGHMTDIHVITLENVNSPDAMTDKILKLAPPQFMLAGHSIGGWIALRLMKIAPERIIKLCILNTAARGIDSSELSARQTILDRIDNGEFQTIAFEIAEKFVFNKHIQQTVLNMFLQVGEQALINQTRAMMMREDLRDTLPAIHCKTLVIHAEQDRRFTLDLVRELSHLIPNSRFKVIPQCGHMSPMEHPQQITDLMREWAVSD
jgi:pimeloyl-ACP methyl ester carboxylesterase